MNSGAENKQCVFIVNSYNRIYLLKESIASLIEFCHVNANYGILVYDAGSTDGSLQWLYENAKEHSFLIIATSGDRKSFSEGCNYAVSFALNVFLGMKSFVLFETDNYLHNHKPIIHANQLLFSSSRLGAVGFTVQNMKKNFLIPGSTYLKTMATIMGLKFSHMFNLERIKIKNWKMMNDFQWHEYEVLYTSPLVIKVSAWLDVNGMDSVNFPFSECDSDLAWRMGKKGYKAAIIQCFGIIHDNLQNKSQWSANRIFDQHRARLSFVKKKNGRIIAFLIRPLLAVRHTIEWGLLNKKEQKSTRKSLIVGALQGYPVKK